MEPKSSVLIVDHSQMRRRAAQQSLENAGYQVTVCNLPNEAMRILSRDSIGVVICFWMPGRDDALTFCKRVRTLDGLKHTALIVTTERRTPDDVLAATDAGADDYIIHPIEPELLLEKVERAAALSARRRGPSAARIRHLFRGRD